MGVTAWLSVYWSRLRISLQIFFWVQSAAAAKKVARDLVVANAQQQSKIASSFCLSSRFF